MLIFTFLHRMPEYRSCRVAFVEFNLLILVFFFFLILVSKFQLLQMIYLQFKRTSDSSFCSRKFVCGQIAVGLSREVGGEEERMEGISDKVLVWFVLLSALAKLRKATLSFAMPVRRSVLPHGKTWLLLYRFAWNLIVVCFLKICWENSSFIRYGKE